MSDKHGLAGKVVLVTGATSGIGRSVAVMLAGQGAIVIAAGRRKELLLELSQFAQGHHQSILPLQMDLTSLESMAKAIDLAEKEWGPIECLVNNAGVARPAKIESVTETDFDEMFGTNVKGAYFVAERCVRTMRQRAIKGRIVNIASIAGLATLPGLSVYGMTKAAAIHMTRYMAKEWFGLGINVNAICPGYIETDINSKFFQSKAGYALKQTLPRKRIGDTTAIHGILLTLLGSETGAFINGAIIPVDDGYLVS